LCNDRYSIVGGNGNGSFIIGFENTGIVMTTCALDREQREAYRLEIEARDSGQPELSALVTLRIQIVDVNDNAPIFNRTEPVYVKEGTYTRPSLGKKEFMYIS